MNIWLISDTHFSHNKPFIVEARGFTFIEDLNEAMITTWNECIKPEDTVYHLGDFAWRTPLTFLSKLNGKITLVRGNHDRKQVNVIKREIPVLDYLELKVDKQHFVLCHYPFFSWNGSNHGSISIHGHSHGKIRETHDKLVGCIDVGVDTNNLKPYNLDEILEIHAKWLASKESCNGTSDDET